MWSVISTCLVGVVMQKGRNKSVKIKRNEAYDKINNQIVTQLYLADLTHSDSF